MNNIYSIGYISIKNFDNSLFCNDDITQIFTYNSVECSSTFGHWSDSRTISSKSENTFTLGYRTKSLARLFCCSERLRFVRFRGDLFRKNPQGLRHLCVDAKRAIERVIYTVWLGHVFSARWSRYTQAGLLFWLRSIYSLLGDLASWRWIDRSHGG